MCLSQWFSSLYPSPSPLYLSSLRGEMSRWGNVYERPLPAEPHGRMGHQSSTALNCKCSAACWTAPNVHHCVLLRRDIACLDRSFVAKMFMNTAGCMVSHNRLTCKLPKNTSSPMAVLKLFLVQSMWTYWLRFFLHLIEQPDCQTRKRENCLFGFTVTQTFPFFPTLPYATYCNFRLQVPLA